MYGTIQKWGNSHALRIPKGILEAVDFQENDRVEFDAENDVIIIRRVKKKHITLKERIENYKGDYRCCEWDTSENQGKEV